MGFVLDVLLYNLRDENPDETDLPLEELDAYGRSEEEQVGADDEEEGIIPAPKRKEGSDKKPGKSPLEVCIAKATALAGKIPHKQKRLEEGTLDYSTHISILLAILAALRLLRSLDGKVPWIAVGQSAVPQAVIQKVFNGIAEALFEGPFSLIYISDLHEEIACTDEFARLKGLIIWLAWESGLCFQKEKSFNEQPEEREVRFGINRLMVSVSQLIGGDPAVADEARQSIGPFCNDNMDWLEDIIKTDSKICDLVQNPESFKDGSTAVLGDFGFNPKLKHYKGVRQVISKDTKNTALAYLNSNDGHNSSLRSNFLRVLPFQHIFKG